MAHEFQFRLNRNGDAPDTLKSEFVAVHEAAMRLEDALNRMTLHGRNYQTLDDPLASFHKDRDAYVAVREQALAVKDWAMDGVVAVIRQREGL